MVCPECNAQGLNRCAFRGLVACLGGLNARTHTHIGTPFDATFTEGDFKEHVVIDKPVHILGTFNGRTSSGTDAF